MSHNTFASEFRGIKVVVSQSELERREKELLLLDNKGGA